MKSPPSHFVFKAVNGRIQISAGEGESIAGIIVERGALFGGVLITRDQAREIGSALLNWSHLAESSHG